VGRLLSSLGPGATATFSFGTTVPTDPIVAEGGSLACSYGGGVVSVHTMSAIEPATLYPGTEYLAYVQAGVVVVRPV
jgi:hypothetical protein